MDAGAVPLLVLCIQEPELSLKRIAASALSDICKHSPELAQTVVDAGAIAHLAQMILNPGQISLTLIRHRLQQCLKSPGPSEFSAQVGPARRNFRPKSARPGEIFGPSRPGPEKFSAKSARPGLEEFSDRVGPARSPMAENSNTG